MAWTKEYGKEYNKKHKKEMSIYQKEYYGINKAEKKIKTWRRKFGLTQADYDALYVSQSGCCAICGILEAETGGRWKRLCVDHDHKTGGIRGLLCPKCNLAMGLLGDNPKIIKEILVYLEKYTK